MATAAVLYLLNSTDDDPDRRIVITPRAYDGPGGVQRTTDLTFYGNGAPNWGERFNENFYHLLENFAVSEQGGSDGVPNNSAVPTPKTETDLGGEAGLGVNNPIEGQLWYNKSRGLMYVYTGVQSGLGGSPVVVGTPRWKPTSNVLVVPDDATRDFFYDTASGAVRAGDIVYNETSDALEIYTGVAWTSTSNYVKKNGDTMTGPLILSEHPSGGSSAFQAATKQYVLDQIGGAGVVTNHAGLTGLLVDDHTQYLNRSGVRPMTGSLNMGNQRISSVGTPTLGTDAMSRDYADARYVNTTGDALAGAFSLSGTLTLLGGASQIVLPNAPSAGTHAVNRDYVDGLLAGAGALAEIAGNKGYIDLNVTISGTPRVITIQWGESALTQVSSLDTTTITFHKQFTSLGSPVDPFQVIASCRGFTGSYTRQMHQLSVKDETITSTQFLTYATRDDSVDQDMKICYVAIGYGD